MSRRFTLQIPMDKKLKVEGDKLALEYGFSNVQEFFRVFLSNLVNGKARVDLSIGKSWGDGLDPEVIKALDQYKRGEYKVIKPTDPIEKVLED